jgi:hypothetical protein
MSEGPVGAGDACQGYSVGSIGGTNGGLRVHSALVWAKVDNLFLGGYDAVIRSISIPYGWTSTKYVVRQSNPNR